MLRMWLLIGLLSILTVNACSIPVPIQRKHALEHYVKATDALADLFETEMAIIPNSLEALAITDNALNPVPAKTSPEQLTRQLDDPLKNWKQASRDMRMAARMTAAMFSEDDGQLHKVLRENERIFKKYPNDPDYQSFSENIGRIDEISTQDMNTPEKRKEYAANLGIMSQELVSGCSKLIKEVSPRTHELASRLRLHALQLSIDPEQPVLVRLAVADKLRLAQLLPIELDSFFTKLDGIVTAYQDSTQAVSDSLVTNKYTMEDLDALTAKAEVVLQQVERIKSIIMRIAPLLMIL
jgi:hypothetical protein